MFEGWTDLKLAFRSLRNSPGFTVAAVAVLALGIGGNTAIFAALRATLLSPPAFPDAERIVLLNLTDSSSVRPDPARSIPWSYRKYQVMAEMRDLPLGASAAYAQRSVTLTGQGDATYLSGEVVTPGYLRVLGVRPTLGRDFTASDDAEGAGLTVMLEHGLWRERFGADPRIVGRSIQLNGRSLTVIGVGPSGFQGLTGAARFWIPVHTGAALISPILVRGVQAHWLRVVARMRPRTNLVALNERMRAVGRAVEATYPARDPTAVRSGGAESLLSARVNPQAEQSLFILGTAGLLLLLVACANLGGLLGARAIDRSREAAVRVALGAGRWRVARGFLAEALVLAFLGGALAVGVAAYGLKGLATLWPERFLDGSWYVRAGAIGSAGVDGTVLSFAGTAAVLAGLLFGAVPALTAGRTDPARELRGGSIPPLGLTRLVSIRSALVTGEIALALVLLVGAGLLIRSLRELQHVNRGFRPGNLVAFNYSLPRTGRLGADEVRFVEGYLDRLARLPDVESAALACVPPLAGHCMITDVRRAGGTTWSEGSRPRIGIHSVSDAFFETLGIRLLQGRTFTSSDRADSRPVVVLSDAAAKRLFPEGGALGSPVALGIDLTPDVGSGVEGSGSEGQTAEVIGVVGDALYDRPEQGFMPEAYVSHRQDEEGSSTILLRTRGEPLAVIPEARAALTELAPDVPLFGVNTVGDLEASVSADTRVLGVLLSTFAALALVLACTGVWAVVAFAVARRTRELGLRMALGASPSSAVALVIKGGVLLALSGLALGSAGAWAASRLLRGVLYGVGPSDPMTFVSAGSVLLGVACVAAWLPARRATRVQPMEALRAE
jgi:putative ABC transport system permease protein